MKIFKTQYLKFVAVSLALSSMWVQNPLVGYAEGGSCCEERIISTQGTGEVKVLPDSLRISVSVESEASSLQQVRVDNNQKMQKILQALKNLNIPNMTLKTQYLHIYPIRSVQEKNKLPKIIGYQATNSLMVTVTDSPSNKLGEYGGQIIDTALNEKANNVGNIEFYVNDLDKPSMEALQKAVQNAKQNAQAMANAAGIALTGLYSIEGTPQYRTPPIYMARESFSSKAMEAPAPTPVEIGETTITTTVNAKFKF